MDLNYVKNCMLTAPGLAISAGGSALVKYGNTVKCKAGGIVGTPIATANCPALSTSLGRLGAAITNIPTLKARYFTLLAAVNPTTSAVTFSWVHGDDFSEITDIGRTKYINGGNSGDENKAIVGYVCIINGTASDFIPGTTVLDVALSSVIYQDAFGFTGM
jgi:hypothetical protein